MQTTGSMQLQQLKAQVAAVKTTIVQTQKAFIDVTKQAHDVARQVITTQDEAMIQKIRQQI